MPTVNGKFVNKTQLMAAGAGVNTSGPVSSQPTVSDQTSKLNAVFASLIAGNPKQVTALNAIYEKLKPPEEPAAEMAARKKKEDAERVIKQLEDFYLTNKLYYGNNLKGNYSNLIEPFVNPNSPASQYKASLMSSAPFFAKASGDTGTLSNQDIERAIKAFPTTRFTKTKAVENFKNVRRKLGLSEGVYDTSDIPTTTGSAQGDTGIRSLGLQFGGK